MGSKKFKILQQQWYRKLEENDFVDIEKDEQVVRHHGADFQTQYTPEEFLEKEKYNEAARALLRRDVFLDAVERRIWALHTLGYSIRRIVLVLSNEGVKRNKNRVNKVINEFQELLFK